MEINRKGVATEYKNGHNYLTYIEWEDGHAEIEIHRCKPELLFHSCDQKKLEGAKKLFALLSAVEESENAIKIEKSQEIKVKEIQ